MYHFYILDNFVLFINILIGYWNYFSNNLYINENESDTLMSANAWKQKDWCKNIDFFDMMMVLRNIFHTKISIYKYIYIFPTKIVIIHKKHKRMDNKQSSTIYIGMRPAFWHFAAFLGGESLIHYKEIIHIGKTDSWEIINGQNKCRNFYG